VPAIAIVLDLPAEVIHERNARRDGRIVDAGVVDRQLAELRQAIDEGRLSGEGFDAVYVIHDPDALEALVLLRSSGPAG